MVSERVCRLWASRSSQLRRTPGARAGSPKAPSPRQGRDGPRPSLSYQNFTPHPQILTHLSFAGTVALQAFSISGARSQTILPHSRSAPPCWPFKKTPNSGSFPQARDNPQSLTWSFHQGCGLSPGKNSHHSPPATPKILIQLGPRSPRALRRNCWSHNFLRSKRLSGGPYILFFAPSFGEPSKRGFLWVFLGCFLSPASLRLLDAPGESCSL